jgi:hypothetical protein
MRVGAGTPLSLPSCHYCRVATPALTGLKIVAKVANAAVVVLDLSKAIDLNDPLLGDIGATNDTGERLLLGLTECAHLCCMRASILTQAMGHCRYCLQPSLPHRSLRACVSPG